MKFLALLGAALALGSSLASAATISGSITNATELEYDTEALLTSYDFEQRMRILPDMSFTFEDVPKGEYVLKIRDRVNRYLAYHIQIPQEEAATPIVTLWQPAIGKVAGAIIPGWPLSIPVQGQWVYKDPPPSFDLIKIVRGNPLLLLLGVGVLITFGGPYLMSTLDPEGMKEVNERSAGMHKSLANFQNGDVTGSVSKFLAGSGESQSEAKESKALGGSSGVQAGAGGTPGKKGKKRR